MRPHVGLEHALKGDPVGVLRGEHQGVELDGLVAVIGDGDLGLAVGAQVGELAALAHLGEALREAVGQVDRQRHELSGVVAGVTEHQTLVAGALLVLGVRATGAVLEGGVHALRDVGALLADGDLDATGCAVEPLGGAVVADPQDGLADNLGDFDIRLGRDLTSDVDEAGGHHRLHSDTTARVLLEHGVQDRVRDLVTDLVGVTFGDRFGREKTG